MAIGLDIGSSSVKAIRTGAGGVASGPATRHRLGTRRLTGGRVEHDPGEILTAARAALRGAIRGAPRAEGILRVGIDTQRSTVLFWERGTGRPLTPAYSWQDLRGRAVVERLRRRARRARRPAGGDLDAFACARTGLRFSPHYAAAKIRWAFDRVRGLERAVASGRVLWGTLGTWLLWHFTGGAVYAIDHANAQRTLLFDSSRLGWDHDLIELFGLQALPEGGALPALVPTTLAGGFPIDADGRPLVIGALTGDQQAALPGLRCRRPGDIVINYGSGAFVLIQVGDRRPVIPGLLATLVDSRRDAAGMVAARYAVEGTVNAAATAIDWARRRLGLRIRVADLDRWLGPEPDGPRTVHFLPAVSGLGAPRWDPAAAPRFAGRTDAGPRDLMRAVVESIAQRCAEIVRTAGRHRGGAGIAAGGAGPVYVSGGLARCRTLLQAQADLLQRPVVLRDLPDASALGAAILADAAAPGRRGEAGIRDRPRRRPSAIPRSGSGGTVVLPRIPRDEAAARVRAWTKAVYGRP